MSLTWEIDPYSTLINSKITFHIPKFVYHINDRIWINIIFQQLHDYGDHSLIQPGLTCLTHFSIELHFLSSIIGNSIDMSQQCFVIIHSNIQMNSRSMTDNAFVIPPYHKVCCN